jgi:hypothetical protein
LYSGDFYNNTAMSACNDPGETSSVTQASPSELSKFVGHLFAASCINNAGTANALASQLAAAQRAIDAVEGGTGVGEGRSQGGPGSQDFDTTRRDDDIKTAINILNAFIHRVQAQSGKHLVATCSLGGVSVDPARLLIAQARGIIDSLNLADIRDPVSSE